ncbi:sensor histidine kinase [Alteribacter natronophilus]|uniref:sensor histidine kinase n=1 Tax=Alteribacter natronophilus TaxID=2583810 RepID=UPI00110E857E|nr:sensor histidine kinase [Alteribacter natronophilus]TMW72901.1 sensor histidine kinase [Alteribacter natronophilus]
MWELMLAMLERLGIIVAAAFIMTRFRFVRHLIERRDISSRHKLNVMVMFGLFGILGTYSGLAVNAEEATYIRWAFELGEGEAIANSRVIGVVVAGLLGGWAVGLGAGMIAGVHRIFLGGFTGLACGLATILAGVIAGWFYKKKRLVNLRTAFFAGAIAETVQMAIILAMARPFDRALQLVESIGIPMIVANGIGAAIFILIVRNVRDERERSGAIQAQKALRLADYTLQYMRQGLNAQSARATCDILLNETRVDAVAITDRENVMAFAGAGKRFHDTNEQIKTGATRKVLADGKPLIADRKDVYCGHRDCPLQTAIIAPLKMKDRTIGTLKFYFTQEDAVTPTTVELSHGLSVMLSHQLELSEVDRHSELAREAEIKALQAQVRPHFLFNTINTIVSLIRTDPDKARKVLVSLSRYFRQNLSGANVTETSLGDEIRHVRAYLDIEEARFSDRLAVRFDLEEDVLFAKVPPMTLQPLVENAVKHGIKNLEDGGEIVIEVKKEGDRAAVSVTDNGAGMPEERIREVGKSRVTSETGTGLGLANVNRRLIMYAGDDAAMDIQSSPGKGTRMTFSIQLEGGERK